MVDQYIEYVQKTVAQYKRYASTIDQSSDSITPALIMECMANYSTVVIMLNAEYQRKKIVYSHEKIQFEMWYDELLVETKRSLNRKEGSDSKSYKISLKEIEAQLKVDNKEEFLRRQEELVRAEHEVAFLRRLLEDWKMVGQMYLGMSNNMRQEMRSYNLINAVERGDTNLRNEWQNNPSEAQGNRPVTRRTPVNGNAG